MNSKFKRNPKSANKQEGLKMQINEAESYGWVVNDYQAREAYDFACEYFGEEDLNAQIVGTLSDEELASSLAFLFRMNDFREWEESLEGNEDGDEDDFDESCKRTNKKVVKESKENNLNINVNTIARQVNAAIKEAVTYINSGDAYPTWHWILTSDDEYNYEIVLGFNSGFEPNDNEFIDSDGNGLCLKWARIKKNSAMNEYDIDYEMPYDEVTGDVWYSEIFVNSFDETDTVKWLIKDFTGYADQYLSND